MNALSKLLNNLEAIGEAHFELYDTDVKEQTGTALIEILFHQNPDYELPKNFGMYSEIANDSIQKAFYGFANDCKDLPQEFLEKLHLLSPEGVISIKGQISECFFGEITEDIIFPKKTIVRRHWFDTPFIFMVFLGLPAVFIVLFAYLLMPVYMSNKVVFLFTVSISVIVSVITGNYLWQYCANKIFRKNVRLK